MGNKPERLAQRHRRNTNREYNKAPLGHFADDSQPGHLTKRPFLCIHPNLTEAQALQALNVYLFLPTDFDWHVIPAEIEGQQLTWAHAIKQAKAYALAADATRPYAYNYPYSTEQHQAPYTPLGQHSVKINRKERTRLLKMDTTFNWQACPTYLTTESEETWAALANKRKIQAFSLVPAGHLRLQDPTDSSRPPLMIDNTWYVSESVKLLRST